MRPRPTTVRRAPACGARARRARRVRLIRCAPAALQPDGRATTSASSRRCAPSTDCRALPYFSLARGFLTGKYRRDGPPVDSQRAASVQQSYFNERGFAVLDALELDRRRTRHDDRGGRACLAPRAAHRGCPDRERHLGGAARADRARGNARAEQRAAGVADRGEFLGGRESQQLAVWVAHGGAGGCPADGGGRAAREPPVRLRRCARAAPPARPASAPAAELEEHLLQARARCRGRAAARALPRVQPDVVVVAAGREERGGGQPRLFLEAERVAVEAARARARRRPSCARARRRSPAAIGGPAPPGTGPAGPRGRAAA